MFKVNNDLNWQPGALHTGLPSFNIGQLCIF